MKRCAALTAIIVVLAASWACSSNGGPAPTPTAEVTTTPQPIPHATVTPGSVIYPYKHYEMTFPSEWTFAANLVVEGNVTLDGVFAPAALQGVKPNLGILTELYTGTAPSLDDLETSKLEIVTKVAKGSVDRANAKIAGYDARKVSYSADGPARDVTEYYVITEQTVFTLQLVTPKGMTPQFEDVLAGILRSFKVI